jgi:hypothetical protein
VLDFGYGCLSDHMWCLIAFFVRRFICMERSVHARLISVCALQCQR